MQKLLGPITQLVTLEGIPLKGPLKDSQLLTIENGGILFEDGIIKEIGKYSHLKDKWEKSSLEIIALKGDHVCVPGYIDAHTHICFHGSRANDYAMRNAGKTYLEIAESGGGIWDTVQKTREASSQNLIDGIIQRANRHLKEGITTIEVKSGYGLSIKEELKILRAIQEAQKQSAAELIPTCLAAHMLPRDFSGTQIEYLEEISEKLFPVLLRDELSNRIDAFIEKSAFSPDTITSYFMRARQLGFDITVHADQFTPGGSKIAVEVGACSADHLEASTEKEIRYLSNSEVTAVALPGASLGLGVSFAPARKLIDAGCSLAIASDWNPGSAPMGNLLIQACILGTFEKLTNAEILAGITYRAANALRLSERGRLKPGNKADFNLYATDHVYEIFYHQGMLSPVMVWKSGKLIYESFNN